LNDFFETSISNKKTDLDTWKACLENARRILHTRDISDKDLEKIFTASNDPEKFNTVIKLLYSYTRSNPNGSLAVKLLINHVDTSHYSLSDWVDAINIFNTWLENEGRKTSWDMMLGYLACCTESPENKDIKHKFTDILSDMLNEHGFEG
jgi:hypothetical protein